MEIFKNFKRFTHKNERLAILAKEIDGELEVFILKCNKNDQFKKSLATTLGAYYFVEGKEKFKKLFPDYHPKIVKVAIEKGDCAGYTFKQFCNLYYTKRKAEFGNILGKHTYEYLECNDEIIILKNTLKWM